MIPYYHNTKYSGGIPLAIGDRYYGQDLFRDFWYTIDRLGLIFNDIIQESKVIISGGIVSKGAGNQLNITACVGYTKFNIDTLDGSVAWSIPPAATTKDIEMLRITSTTQLNLSIPSAVLDDVTVNYVKLAYAEANGISRTRAKKAGSYYYNQLPSFIITCDDTAPTAYEIELARFVSSGGAVPATFDLSGRDYEIREYFYDNIYETTSDYTMTDYDGYDTIIVKPSSNSIVVLDLPEAAKNIGRKIKVIFGNSNYATVVIKTQGSDKICNWSYIVLFRENEEAEFLSNGTDYIIINNWKWHIESGMINRSTWQNVHLGWAKCHYSGSTGTPVIYETYIGGTSGSRGLLIYDDGSSNSYFVYCDDGSGSPCTGFISGEILTGQDSGATFTLDANSKNADSDIIHNLGRGIKAIDKKLIISTGGTEATTYDTFFNQGRGGENHGCQLLGIDMASFKIQTGLTRGPIFMNDSGNNTYFSDTDDYYYDLIIEIGAVT